MASICTAGVMAKENAVKLLQEGWEDINTGISREMVLYYIDIEEMDLKAVMELESRLSLQQDPEKEGAWLITGDILTEICWNSKNTVYHSWILAIPGKKAEIGLKTTLITAGDTDLSDYIRIVIEPLKIYGKEIYSYLTLEYKVGSGTVSRMETGLWTGKRSEKPVVLLRKRSDQGQKEEYRYFALYLNSQYIKGNFLKQQEKIMVINNINGINDIFTPEKSGKSILEWGGYIGADGGGFEFIRESGGNILESTIFINSGKADFQLGFHKKLMRKGGPDGVISLNNNKLPYVMCGISDRLDYINGLSCQLIYYPVIFSPADTKSSTVELRIGYEKEYFKLGYRTIYRGGEFENRLKLNYSLTKGIALSTIWEERNHEEYYYLGIIVRK
ncbi:MAG: hypothetical protein GX175_02110 [Halanaerobiaceae bacterium]|nr:hypothetical protein [Halanaerobiaceae bacterium]